MKNFEIGIVGAGLQSALIAGLLQRDHKKKTCLFLSRAVQHQVAREICFSFNFATRPQTWEIQKLAIAESLPLITSVGGGPAIAKTNAFLICHTEEAAEMLAHMYHFLHGMEYRIERLSKDEVPNAKAAYRVFGVRLVRQQILWPAIFSWLASLGVEVFEPDGLEVKSHRDGTSRIKLGEAQMNINRLVLADEQAILAHASPTVQKRLFVQKESTAVLTLPTLNDAEQVVLNPENDFFGHLNHNGSISAVASVSLDKMGHLLKHNIPLQELPQLSGRALFNNLISKDGAPIVGRLGRSGLWGIAGFGPPGIFYSSMLARQICDTPKETEKAFFEAHRGDNTRNTQLIQESYCSSFGGKNGN